MDVCHPPRAGIDSCERIVMSDQAQSARGRRMARA